MDFLSREMLKAAQGRRFDVVVIPDVGNVRLGSPSARQAQAFKKLFKRRESGDDVDSDLFALALGCVVDGEGKPVFSNEETQAKQDEWSLVALEALLLSVVKLLAPQKTAAEEAAAAVPSDPSPSDS